MNAMPHPCSQTCILLTDQLQVYSLISLKMIMGGAKITKKSIIPFKKFSRLRFNITISQKVKNAHIFVRVVHVEESSQTDCLEEEFRGCSTFHPTRPCYRIRLYKKKCWLKVNKAVSDSRGHPRGRRRRS